MNQAIRFAFAVCMGYPEYTFRSPEAKLCPAQSGTRPVERGPIEAVSVQGS